MPPRAPKRRSNPVTEPSLPILLEDHHFIAVNKPAPLSTQAPSGIDSLEARVRHFIKVAYSKPAGVYLGIPHRLDRPVSGVVVFARNSKAAARLAEQFQQHSVRKTYWAVVEGVVPEDSGIWRDWLRKIPDEPRGETTSEGEPGAKSAETAFRVLLRAGNRTWLELLPKTGRMHQLRLQTSTRGFPVVGDRTYGSSAGFGPVGDQPWDWCMALHARSLEFDHPFRKNRLTVVAPVPEVWATSFPEFDFTSEAVPPSR
jgi:23S rRNA pseudouridine1911/1915/1917 synthase